MIQIEEEKFKEVISGIKKIRQDCKEQADNFSIVQEVKTGIELPLILSLIDIELQKLLKLLGIKENESK